jgi:uncharacterized membrane protein
MAGIGFELRRLSQRGGLFGQVAAGGHATFVTAGPWLVTVLALGIVQRNIVAVAPPAEAYLLQALVIYAFCLTLLIAAPITIAAVRVSADDLYDRRVERVRGNFMLAVAACCLAGVALAVPLFAFGFGLAGADLLVAAAGVGAIAMVWPAMAFASMVKAYGSITLSFLAGLTVSVLATLTAASHGLGVGVQASGFAAGLGLAAISLTATVTATFPGRMESLRGSVGRMLGAARGHLPMVGGAAVAVAAVWADSWLVWLGPLGRAAGGGLPTAPFYDSAMFVARLSMLPGLIAFLLSVDTAVHQRTRAFMSAIEDHGTLRRIESSLAEIGRTADSSMVRLIVLQAACCAILLALAPAVVAPAGLQYQQIGVLRFGILGALFHSIFFAATTLVLHFGRGRAYLGLQLIFCGTNAAATAATMVAPPQYLGMGYLAATALSAVAALAVLRLVLGRLDYLTFHDALALHDATARRASRNAMSSLAKEATP